MLILEIVEALMFFVLSVNVIYLLVFSIASHVSDSRKQLRVQNNPTKRIAVLIPAYKEDFVIEECVDSCLAQHYPKELFDVVVISDRMSEETNDRLARLPLKLLRVYFENSTKAKALNMAMEQIGDGYDIAIVLDADNTVAPDFLSRIEAAFSTEGVRIVQAHRCAKNINTPLAVLDAVSEEINNSVFRLGHVNLGLSAALIGSGMAFEYGLFKNTMLSIDAIGGFDRALELKFLREGIRVHYLPDVDVLDEKVQRHGDFSRQRRRWLSAQFHYLSKTYKQLGGAIKECRWDFCDKLYQQTSVPRVMLLGFCFLIPLVVSFFSFAWSIKWWILFLLLIVAMLLAIPRTLYRKELLHALFVLPFFFLVMVLNLFRLKGANKRFIHTQHGVKS